MVNMTEPFKKALLDVHNRLRSDIALGKIAHYNKASNMETITWDDGLAGKKFLKRL